MSQEISTNLVVPWVSPRLGPVSLRHDGVPAPRSPVDERAAFVPAPRVCAAAPGTPDPPPLAAHFQCVQPPHALQEKQKTMCSNLDKMTALSLDKKHI